MKEMTIRMDVPDYLSPNELSVKLRLRMRRLAVLMVPRNVEPMVIGRSRVILTSVQRGVPVGVMDIDDKRFLV